MTFTTSSAIAQAVWLKGCHFAYHTLDVDRRADQARRAEGTAEVGDFDAIIPSIEGSAYVSGLNTIFVDERDPLAHGFQLI